MTDQDSEVDFQPDEDDYLNCDRCGEIIMDEYFYFPIDLPALQTVLTVCESCLRELEKE